MTRKKAVIGALAIGLFAISPVVLSGCSLWPSGEDQAKVLAGGQQSQDSDIQTPAEQDSGTSATANANDSSDSAGQVSADSNAGIDKAISDFDSSMGSDNLSDLDDSNLSDSQLGL